MTFMLYVPSQPFLIAIVYFSVILNAYWGDVSCLSAGNYPLNRPALNTRDEYVGMLSRTHAGTSDACGARALLGELYPRNPLG